MSLDFKMCGYLAVALLLSACSPDQKPQGPTAFVQGRITVADSIDSSADYSGIEVSIVKKDSAQAAADTLFYQATDSSGTFSGMASFPENNFYTMFINRNQRRLGQYPVILADGDSVRIEGELPNLQQSLEIHSTEHDALSKFRRLNNGYQRVARYIQAGALKGDSLVDEITKWGGLYWDLYEEQKGTIAGRMSAVESIRMFGSVDGEKMIQKLRELRDDERLVSLAAQYGKEYLARNKGLDYSLNYLDTLQTITRDTQASMNIQQERIKLLYDSARIDQAKTRLNGFKEKYGMRRSARDWIESIEYDLHYLSPGDTIPTFAFKYNGQTISRDSLKGTPYILEITLLSNRLYQRQYDRTFVIHNIYKNFGLQVITIPLDQSQVTIDAFFEERTRAWPVASADAFDRQELVEKFNVRMVPTRFLVNEQGEIVRKYIGQEYQDIIQGIQMLIRTEQEEPAL